MGGHESPFRRFYLSEQYLMPPFPPLPKALEQKAVIE